MDENMIESERTRLGNIVNTVEDWLTVTKDKAFEKKHSNIRQGQSKLCATRTNSMNKSAE